MVSMPERSPREVRLAPEMLSRSQTCQPEFARALNLGVLELDRDPERQRVVKQWVERDEDAGFGVSAQDCCDVAAERIEADRVLLARRVRSLTSP